MHPNIQSKGSLAANAAGQVRRTEAGAAQAGECQHCRQAGGQAGGQRPLQAGGGTRSAPTWQAEEPGGQLRHGHRLPSPAGQHIPQQLSPLHANRLLGLLRHQASSQCGVAAALLQLAPAGRWLSGGEYMVVG